MCLNVCLSNTKHNLIHGIKYADSSYIYLFICGYCKEEEKIILMIKDTLERDFLMEMMLLFVEDLW